MPGNFVQKRPELLSNISYMKFLFVLFLLPLQLLAQDITGVWTGTLYSDSTRYIRYELAISEYNGELSGYSHTIFVVDSVENVGVKSIKVKKDDEKFLLEDDKLIYNNYTAPPAKGVKMYSELSFSQNDTALVLSGSWKTNRTKQYAAINGTIFLQKKKDVKESLLIAKLDTLKLTRSLSFMVPGKQINDLGKINEPVFNSMGYNEQATDVVKTAPANKVASDKTAPVNKPQELPKINSVADISKDSLKERVASQLSVNKGLSAHTESLRSKQAGIDTVKETAAQSNQQPGTKKEASPDKEKTKDVTATNVERPAQKKDSSDIVSIKAGITQPIIQPANKIEISNVVTKQNGPTNKDITKDLPPLKTTAKLKPDSSNPVVRTAAPQMSNQQNTQKEVTAIIQKKKTEDNTNAQTTLITRAAAAIATRKIEAIRNVDIKADSLILTLYDNGEVDGDTVSVLLNGKVIMPMEGLSLKAITKTIYLTPEMGDSVVLIMYAENLGSIPPNTGLLVVHDGDDVYEIRFSGDLTKNSSIILKRRKKPGK
jgi:hypothetical protein